MKNTKKKVENHVTLTVEDRKVVGKKVKKMRRDGLLPANVFGKDFKSVSISMKYSDFTHVYKIAHETGIVYLQLNKQEIPSLVKHIQRHPLHSTVLHVDFRKIDLTEKIETDVPVKVTGVSPAVSQKGGVLITQSTHLTVKALPQDIPAAIDVDISGLTELGQDIKVNTLAKSTLYEIVTEPEKVIVSVTAHKEESVVAETTAAAAPEVLTAKPDEGAEEATPEKKDDKPADPATSAEKKSEGKK